MGLETVGMDAVAAVAVQAMSARRLEILEKNPITNMHQLPPCMQPRWAAGFARRTPPPVGHHRQQPAAARYAQSTPGTEGGCDGWNPRWILPSSAPKRGPDGIMARPHRAVIMRANPVHRGCRRRAADSMYLEYPRCRRLFSARSVRGERGLVGLPHGHIHMRVVGALR